MVIRIPSSQAALLSIRPAAKRTQSEKQSQLYSESLQSEKEVVFVGSFLLNKTIVPIRL